MTVATMSDEPYGKPCTCDNCLGSSCPCRVDAGGVLGALWYCRKRAEADARANLEAPPSVQSEPAFLIFYDDQDRSPEVFILGGNAETAARQRFEQVLGRGWNAHLFKRIDDGKRSPPEVVRA